jgi:hypothetical protein
VGDQRWPAGKPDLEHDPLLQGLAIFDRERNVDPIWLPVDEMPVERTKAVERSLPIVGMKSQPQVESLFEDVKVLIRKAHQFSCARCAYGQPADPTSINVFTLQV